MRATQPWDHPPPQRTHGAGVPLLVLRARGSPLLRPQGDPPALSQEGQAPAAPQTGPPGWPLTLAGSTACCPGC